MKIEIKGIIEASLLDWDGEIVTTLYVPACNFRCPFCHNWKLFEHPEEYEEKTFSEIEKVISDRDDFLDGICITGGEPTLYEDLPEFIRKIRALGMQVKLDTNGTNPKMLREIIQEGLVEYVAMDIKAPFDGRYHKLSGVKADIDSVKESAGILMTSAIDYEFRTTVVPTLLKKEDIVEIAESIRGAQRYVLQQFVPKNTYSESLREVKAYDDEEIEEMVTAGREYVKDMCARGVG